MVSFNKGDIYLKNKRSKYLIYFFLFTIFFMSFANADTYPQGNDVLISHPIRIDGAVSSSIDANISVKNTVGNFVINNQVMTYNSSTAEHEFLIAEGNLSAVGVYPYCITATGNGLNSTGCFDFEITPSGFSRISAGEGIIVFGGLLIMFSIAIFSFVLFLRSETPTGKITFISVAGIFLLITTLFSTILIQQNLGGFGNILSGYETFVFVIKTVVTISVLAFFVVIGLFMLKAWRLKNGLME